MDQVAYAHYHLADRMQPLISDSHPSSFITTKVTNSRDSSRRAEAVGVRVLGYNIIEGTSSLKIYWSSPGWQTEND